MLKAQLRPLFFLTILIMLAMIIGGLQWYYVKPGPLREEQILLFPTGTSLSHIAHTLAANKVIDWPSAFIVTAVLRKKADRLKAGEYAFYPHIPVREVMLLMQSGKQVVHKFTVPEGGLTYEVIERLEQDPILQGDIVNKPAYEGTLLPDTYHYQYGETRLGLLMRMQHAMNHTLQELWQERDPDLPLKTPEEALVLASIVEKETGQKGERPRVASVFYNRLAKKMKLQADPTTSFAITLGKAPLGRLLTRADLKVDSPYNTYVVTGLPPHPIANPGRAALHAVMHPLLTKDLYFVVGENGGHAFASTLAEHNRNVAAYRAKQSATEIVIPRSEEE
jgi:UPF0755 protein